MRCHLALFACLGAMCLPATQESLGGEHRTALADAIELPPLEKPPPIAGPRELLDLLGVEESHFRALRDGRPVDLDERQYLLRFLYAVRRFEPRDSERWARPLADLLLAEDAAAERGELFHLTGKVTHVAVERPVPEVIERLEISEYYRCTFEPDDGGTATVFATKVPDAWPREKPMSEPASVRAVFLKWTAIDPHAEPVFAAARVAWHPPTVLGELAADVGLFDDVQNGADLVSADRECFYQLLAAAGRADNAELLRRAAHEPDQRDYSVVPLFNEADKQHGKLVVLSGTAVRVVEVRVEDANVRRRFGIDHYYQIDLIAPDSQNNPLVFCVRELPEGMPRGADARASVRIAGFFFKTWSYRQQRVEPDQEPLRQLAPMLIGRAPVWFPPESGGGSALAQAVAAALFLVAMGGIAFALWRAHRGDRALRARLRVARQSGREPSLDTLGLEAQDKPDFSGL